MLTFESTATQGATQIVQKLAVCHWIENRLVQILTRGQDLPFQNVKHRVDTLDAQPSNEAGGIIVLVTGALQVEDQDRPMSYVQTFQLMPEASTYFIFNDVFKLVYPAA